MKDENPEKTRSGAEASSNVALDNIAWQRANYFVAHIIFNI